MANYARGKVDRIYPSFDGCYIRLANPTSKPKDNYFYLKLSHPNYNSLYSLAVVSAVNGYDLNVQTQKDIIPSEFGEVSYLYVDW